ncbi:MAG: 2Fe-2S iron-sulfur cluster-binding protein [Bacteroidia bacterium]
MSIRFYSLPIVEIRDESPDAYSLFFENPDPEVFRYHAGQYLTLKVNINGEEERRAFSLASTPGHDETLRITIKRVPEGKVSNYLRDELKVGDSIEVLPPMGSFKLIPDPEQSREYVLIAAGSGITPLMSMLKTVLHDEPQSRVTLWYGNRKEEDIVFLPELSQLTQAFGDRLSIRYTLSQASEDWKGFEGRLDEERIFKWISNLFMRGELRKRYYLCGPAGMMEAAERALIKQAVNTDDIYQEYYSAPLPSEEEIARSYAIDEQGQEHISDGENDYILDERTITMKFEGQTHHLSVQPDEYILDAAIKINLEPPYSCQAGTCSSCKAMLVSGTVAMDESLGLSDEELEQGYVLTCQCHPLDDDVVVEFE